MVRGGLNLPTVPQVRENVGAEKLHSLLMWALDRVNQFVLPLARLRHGQQLVRSSSVQNTLLIEKPLKSGAPRGRPKGVTGRETELGYGNSHQNCTTCEWATRMVTAYVRQRATGYGRPSETERVLVDGEQLVTVSPSKIQSFLQGNLKGEKRVLQLTCYNACPCQNPLSSLSPKTFKRVHSAQLISNTSCC